MRIWSKGCYGLLMLMVALLSREALAADVVRLPTPVTTGGKPLMQTLKERQSVKKFNGKALDLQILSNLLWAAVGVNRDNGKLTIPTSMNKQDLEVYVVKEDGIWLYNAKENVLQNVYQGDARPLVAKQAYVKNAAVNLVFVTNNNEANNMNNAYLHAGSAYQNVGLFCASVGLNCVVRSSIDKRGLSKAMQLAHTKSILISQSVGWPAGDK